MASIKRRSAEEEEEEEAERDDTLHAKGALGIARCHRQTEGKEDRADYS